MARIVAEWNDLNDGAAGTVMDIVTGLIGAVRSGTVTIGPSRKELPAKMGDSHTPECAHRFEDAMIAHRWFAERFGDVMNGRDFATKCAMADGLLAQAGWRDLRRE